MCNTIYSWPLRYATVHTPNMKMKSNKCDSVLPDTSAHLSQLCSILAFISQQFAYRNFSRWKFDAQEESQDRAVPLATLQPAPAALTQLQSPSQAEETHLMTAGWNLGVLINCPLIWKTPLRNIIFIDLLKKIKKPTNCCCKLVHNNKQQYQFISVPSLSTSKAPGALNNRVKINTT